MTRIVGRWRIVFGSAALSLVFAAVLAWLLMPPATGPSLLMRAAKFGGPFTLTAHDGSRFDSRTLAGRPYVIFFGFTRCPDICPTTLLEMSNHLQALGPRADQLTTLFVSIDPERDTPAHLAAYLADFDSRITGLTGSLDEVDRTARQFRVFYEKVATSGGYTMNHTATVYLMDGAGQLVGTMSFQEPQEIQMQKLSRLVAR
jgi:protein SCO1/2